MALVYHRNSNHKLAWRPIPEPQYTGSARGWLGGGMVVECRKKHKGKKMLSVQVKNTRTTLVFPLGKKYLHREGAV